MFVFLVDLWGSDVEAGEEEHFNDFPCELGHAIEESLEELGIFLNPVRHGKHFVKHLVHQVNIIVAADSLHEVKVDPIALDQVSDKLNDLPDHR